MLTDTSSPSLSRATVANEVIQPRWEWRLIEPEPSEAIDSAVATAQANGEPAASSDEIYVLSPDSPHNVKVRGGQLDVKELEETIAGGLERWRPTLKQAFPVARESVVIVCRALAISSPRLTQSSYTLEELLRELLAAKPALRVVRVTKHRTRLSIAGCPGEHATIHVNGSLLATLALEHTDPVRVTQAVTELGLSGRRTTNYPAALKRVVGLVDDDFTQPTVLI